MFAALDFESRAITPPCTVGEHYEKHSGYQGQGDYSCTSLSGFVASEGRAALANFFTFIGLSSLSVTDASAIVSAVATLVIAIFTIILSCATRGMLRIANLQREDFRSSLMAAIKSANAAEKAADVAEEGLSMAQRAWVHVDVLPGGPIVYDINGINIQLTFKMTNTGLTPARHTWIKLHAFPFTPEKSDLQAEQRAFGVQRTGLTEMGIGATIFPQKDITWRRVCTIPLDQIKDAAVVVKASDGSRDKHMVTFCIVGSVSYKIAFKNSVHQTGFICRLLTVSEAGEAESIDVANPILAGIPLIIQDEAFGAYTD